MYIGRLDLLRAALCQQNVLNVNSILSNLSLKGKAETKCCTFLLQEDIEPPLAASVNPLVPK